MVSRLGFQRGSLVVSVDAWLMLFDSEWISLLVSSVNEDEHGTMTAMTNINSIWSTTTTTIAVLWSIHHFFFTKKGLFKQVANGNTFARFILFVFLNIVIVLICIDMVKWLTTWWKWRLVCLVWWLNHCGVRSSLNKDEVLLVRGSTNDS